MHMPWSPASESHVAGHDETASTEAVEQLSEAMRRLGAYSSSIHSIALLLLRSRTLLLC